MLASSVRGEVHGAFAGEEKNPTWIHRIDRIRKGSKEGRLRADKVIGNRVRLFHFSNDYSWTT